MSAGPTSASSYSSAISIRAIVTVGCGTARRAGRHDHAKRVQRVRRADGLQVRDRQTDAGSSVRIATAPLTRCAHFGSPPTRSGSSASSTPGAAWRFLFRPLRALAVFTVVTHESRKAAADAAVPQLATALNQSGKAGKAGAEERRSLGGRISRSSPTWTSSPSSSATGPAQPRGEKERRRFARSRHRRAQELRARHGRDHSADRHPRQPRARDQRIPLPPPRQGNRARPDRARSLAGHERHEQPGAAEGVPTVEPVFGISATWITDEEKRAARRSTVTRWSIPARC